jgi:hypothetical protein
MTGWSTWREIAHGSAEVMKEQSRSIDRMARYGSAARVARHVDIPVLARHSAPRFLLFSFRTGAVSCKTRNSWFS